jgi:predicted PurR-regulated permease PerM
LPLVAGSALVTIVLTLFLLIFGDRLQRRIVACGRTFAARRRIVVVLSQVQSDLTRYLGTITLINLGLGVVVAGVMFWLGLPNPVLWGAVACVLNFAPYIGAMLTAATLLLVGFSSFDTVPQMLGPALAFLGLTIVEGQFLTPMLLGHRLELSPLVVFVAVMTLGWLWGLVGALLAVPIVASVRIILGGAPGCRPLARLLAR